MSARDTSNPEIRTSKPVSFLTWRKATASTRRLALATLGAIVLAAAVVNLVPAIERFALSRPPTCMLKIATNVPCMGCRGTRAGFAFAHGKIGQSAALNPLAASLGIAVSGWSVLTGVFGRIPELRLGKSAQKLAWIAFGFALLGNWIYVIAAGG